MKAETFLKGLGIEKPNNLTDNDVDYTCNICKDKGHYKVTEFSEVYNEEIEVSVECSCVATKRTKRYLKNSGLELMLDNTVNNFEITHPHQKSMKDMATEYVLKGSRDWFVMLGASGSGKSHLCSAVAKTLIDKGLETKYIVWTTFVNELNALMFQGNDADARALDRFKQVPVLYIDDFLKGRSTPYNMTVAFDLLNYRVINNLTTIISSELTIKDMEQVDEAVSGRITQSASGYIMEIPKSKVSNYRMANSKIRIA